MTNRNGRRTLVPGAHNGSRMLTLSAAAFLLGAAALTQAAEEWPRALELV